MFIGTWWSLVPPLLAIVLAFLTKEVYSSLFVGVAVGALLYTGFSPWDSFVSFFEIMKESMNLNILPPMETGQEARSGAKKARFLQQRDLGC